MPFNGERLRLIREKRDVTQEQLAAALKTSRQLIGSYENGAHRPGVDRLERIVEYLRTNIDYLMGRSTYDGEFTEAHAQLSAAFDKGDINAIIALVGEQVAKQKPPEKRASSSAPRAKKKLSLRR